MSSAPSPAEPTQLGGARNPTRDRWARVLADARPWTPPDRRTVVIAPHPDDETLSCAGLIVQQRRAGVEVVIVAITDGDAAYDPGGDAALADRRRGEQSRALGHLGVAAGSIIRLGVPDGRTNEHEHALLDALSDIAVTDDLVVAPWLFDHHPDHESAGRAALAVARRRGCLLEFSLFWTWHHTEPNALLAAEPLNRLALSTRDTSAKQRALACHSSQFATDDGSAPVLDHGLVEPARWRDEFFIDGESHMRDVS